MILIRFSTSSVYLFVFFFSSRRRHTRLQGDWSSDVCSSDLPDVKLTGERQQLGISPFYYESESSVGYFRHTFANDITNAFAAYRADTFHQLDRKSVV